MIIIPLLLAIILTVLAARRGYFTLPPLSPGYEIKFFEAAGAFLTYIVVSIIYIPVLLYFKDKTPHSWLNISYLGALFGFLCLYLLFLKRSALHTIFWDGHSPSWDRLKKSCLMGVITYAISYPYVIVINAITTRIAEGVWGERADDQVAIRFLKTTLDQPLLLICTLFAVIILVPFVEEVLFRGFLQSWCRRFFGRAGAIIVTAGIFAAVHYSPKQNNFEILSALFALSLFLGFVYERERSLWAPYTLHALFNAVSSALVILS